VKQLWRNVQQSSFYVKWTNWEYYPLYLANIPTVLFWLYFGIRSRSLFYFSTVNPVIETGGVLGESKINIYNRLPKKTYPKTIYVEKKDKSLSSVLNAIKIRGLEFPLIVKPNIGERGFLVEKISSKEKLEKYLEEIAVDFIIQEFIDYPIEISVLYHRFPDAEHGKITSICEKKNLSVIGDGSATVEELMIAYPRARFQVERFRKDYPEKLFNIPSKGEEFELEPIGNHCRGTTFLNGNKYIDTQLEKVFDAIAIQMKGIHYGRFDMKCKSIDLLKKGEGFKILEFNGIASEPAHIYDPSYSTWQAYKDIYKHWKIIFQLSKVQREKGVSAMSISDAINSIRTYRHYMKLARS